MDIYFQGLMVHAAKVDGSASIHVAYLIPAVQHTTLLSVDTGVLNTSATTAVGDDGAGSGGPSGTEAKCYALTGRIWTDLGTRVADLTPLNLLPSLRDDFAGGTTNADPAGLPYFEVPDGSFSFPNYFQCQVAFQQSGSDARCVPRTVQLHLAVPATKDVSFMINDPANKVVVHGDASVWITNSCLGGLGGQCSSSGNPVPLPNPHSDAYGNFYKPPKSVAPPRRGRPCTTENTKELPAPRCVFHTLDIDCASSRFP